MSLLRLFGTFLGGWLFTLLIICLIFGVIGMFTWPYTVNTWVGYAHVDDKAEWNPLGKGGGFLLGVCPGIGQLSIPAAIITGVCDMVFIPDGEKSVSNEETSVISAIN